MQQPDYNLTELFYLIDAFFKHSSYHIDKIYIFNVQSLRFKISFNSKFTDLYKKQLDRFSWGFFEKVLNCLEQVLAIKSYNWADPELYITLFIQLLAVLY